jgi:hypothetical protein
METRRYGHGHMDMGTWTWIHAHGDIIFFLSKRKMEAQVPVISLLRSLFVHRAKRLSFVL